MGETALSTLFGDLLMDLLVLRSARIQILLMGLGGAAILGRGFIVL